MLKQQGKFSHVGPQMPEEHHHTSPQIFLEIHKEWVLLIWQWGKV